MENTGNRSYLFYIPALVAGLLTALFLCMVPHRAEASVAIVDYGSYYYNGRTAIYSESYDYYFILESTPEQGRKLVMSTAPFVVTCDGDRDASGAYTLELSSPGGNVFVRHFAHNQFQEYSSKFENNGSGTVLRFKYWGQDYETNCDFSSSGGVKFSRSANITTGAMYSMIAYLKAQDVLLERYPYYVFGYNAYSNLFVLWLSERDPLKTSGSCGIVCCTFDAAQMKIANFSTGNNGLYFNNDFARVSEGDRKLGFIAGASNVCLYSNMGTAGSTGYLYVFYNPYPNFEQLTGTSKPKPTPTPTPLPAPFYEYVDSLGALRNVKIESVLGSMWMVKYNLIHDGQPIHNGVVCDDVYMTARIVLPSRTYVKEHFLTAADRSELITEDVIADWRVNGNPDSRTAVVYEDVYENALMGFTLGEDLRKAVLDNWVKIYGESVPKGYIDEVMAYAYPGVLAVRIQTEASSTRTYIGPLTLTYPVKLYMSYEEYGKDLSMLGGYVEILLAERTAGMTLTQIQDRAGKILDKEIEDGKGDIEDSKKTIEELRKRIAELNVEIAELRAAGSMDVGSIFSVFGSVADGFRSSFSAFRSIAGSVGAVFAFLPAEIISVIGITFVCLLVIAVYHALRG